LSHLTVVSEEAYRTLMAKYGDVFQHRFRKDLTVIWTTSYNNKDMEPLLEAIDKMYLYYQNQNVGIFKYGISVPGLTLKYMFQDLHRNVGTHRHAE
jgi:hypothetical protein